MDLSKFFNPYDFANPVNERDLFVGRTAEIDDIKYYLDHARKASRPINLAILGSRASGKTSVLNMSQIEAEEREFCVIRVDLDEADSKTQLAFFYKIFDSMLTTACSFGAYGGLEGKTYDIYRSIVDAYEIPEDKTFCPFIFPVQYAKAMSRANADAALSDTAFKRDITNIRKELNRPVAVILDECDVLTRSRVHLEKMRNIFMNSPGFMLVLTGTPALFPLMNDVFSPIVRQFKKINIGPFTERMEAQNCIRKPLEKIGVVYPSETFFEIFDHETYRDVSDIQGITGGRPYEIQLVCHVLFRRMQEGRAKRMELTIDVLDDVRKELETSQDVSVRPILSAIRNFDEKQLKALGLLCVCSGHAKFEQIWFCEYVFRGEEEWMEKLLYEHLREFEKAGVVTIKDNIINFGGDDFDRIYFKYLARKEGVPHFINDFSLERFLTINLDSFLRKEFKGIRPFPGFTIGGREKPEIQEIAKALSDDRTDVDPFEWAPNAAEELYWSCLKFRGSDNFHVWGATITTPWIRVHRWYRFKDPKAANERPLEDLASTLTGPSHRAVILGGDVEFEIHTMPVVPVEKLVKKVEQSDNTRMKNNLGNRHQFEMIGAYLERGDIEEALFHVELAYRYSPTPQKANNLGYLFLVSDSLQKARELLEKAAKGYERPEDSALPNYDLGVVEAKEGNLEPALTKFKLAIEQTKASEKKEMRCLCLVLPKIAAEEKKLEFQEVREPDLIETAQSAASAIEELLSRS